MTTTPTSPAQPVPPTERIEGLDHLRGFALLGVFLVNAFVSARPFEEALAPPPPSAPWGEPLAWGIFHGLLLTKFVTLFSLLFGMGLVLQAERARNGTEKFERIYRRRLGLLALMGLAHGCLLFEGDILLPYAVVGYALFRLRRSPIPVLLGIAIVSFLVGTALDVGWSFLDGQGGGMSDFDKRVEAAKRSGTLADLLRIRPIEYGAWLLVSSVTSFNWRVVALFFAGAALMRSGLLAERHRRLHAWAGALGIVGGVGLESIDMAQQLSPEAQTTVEKAVAAVTTGVGSLVLSVGYGGVVLALGRASWARPVLAALGCVGRTALTNYLLQSVAMNVLFYPLGFGLYDRCTRPQVLLLVTAIYLLQVAASSLWLSRFPMGPVEWLWRRWTYRPTRKA